MRAGDIEDTVWKEVEKVIRHPKVIMK